MSHTIEPPLPLRARWYIGMPSASYAADPGSNPGEGGEQGVGITKQIDCSATSFIHFLLKFECYRYVGFENDCGDNIADGGNKG